MTRAEKRRTMKAEQKKEQYAKSGFNTSCVEPKNTNKYNITPFEAMSGYAFYDHHFNSNPQYKEYRETRYTFFGDMLCYFPYYTGKKLLNELQNYEQGMLNRYCKGNPEALEIMIDSLNLLGWVIYEKVGGARDEIAEWLFNEYERLMYRDWKMYVSEEEMEDIWHNLN